MQANDKCETKSMILLDLPIDRIEVWNHLGEYSSGRRGGSWAETLRLAKQYPNAMGEIALGKQVTSGDLFGLPLRTHLRVIVCEREGQFVLRWNNPDVPHPGVYHKDLLPDREHFQTVRSGWIQIVDMGHVEVRGRS
jgi:hypothetical protein